MRSRAPRNDTGDFVGGAPAWWTPDTVPKQVSATIEYLRTIASPAAHAAKPVNGLLLYGPPGTGKTSAGIGMLYIWGRNDPYAGARFQDFGELMVQIRSAWRKDAKETTEQILERLIKPRVLLLDDIGKRATPEDQETASTLINARINRGRPTFCTTNLDLSTPAGQDLFSAACDRRVLERYTKLDVPVHGLNLRSV